MSPVTDLLGLRTVMDSHLIEPTTKSELQESFPIELIPADIKLSELSLVLHNKVITRLGLSETVRTAPTKFNAMTIRKLYE